MIFSEENEFKKRYDGVGGVCMYWFCLREKSEACESKGVEAFDPTDYYFIGILKDPFICNKRCSFVSRSSLFIPDTNLLTLVWNREM